MNERQRLLEKELREYEKHTVMTSEERASLRRWVRAGNSVHENPSGAQYGGIGGPSTSWMITGTQPNLKPNSIP